jgi:hypothetical protein
VEEEEEILREYSGVGKKSVKKQIRKLFMRLGAENRKEEREMENFYYQCIYDIIQNPEKRRRSMAAVNKFKAKIVQLHSASMGAAKLDVEDRVTNKDDIMKQKSRREQRTVTRILDQRDSEQTTYRGIVVVFQEFLRSKFKPISVDAECVRRMMEAVQCRLSEVKRDALDRPLELEKLRRVLQKGGGNKAPGRDVICRAFFTETWEDLKED